MNELRSYFEQNEERLIYKFDHYFDVYERYFSKFKNANLNYTRKNFSRDCSGVYPFKP
jgi:hypothetical protein